MTKDRERWQFPKNKIIGRKMSICTVHLFIPYVGDHEFSSPIRAGTLSLYTFYIHSFLKQRVTNWIGYKPFGITLLFTVAKWPAMKAMLWRLQSEIHVQSSRSSLGNHFRYLSVISSKFRIWSFLQSKTISKIEQENCKIQSIPCFTTLVVSSQSVK